MKVLDALIAGLSGAEGGSVELYQRGTSTRATWYTSFEGTTAVATGADVALDSSGRATVYVNGYVTVVAKTSAGTTVTTFTAGEAATAVEYRGTSFTGADYTTGATGTGSAYPTSVQAILDLWLTSSGTTNFNVLVAGVSTTLQTAMGAFGGVFFNVKSPTYGAVGDGVANDTAAIQAAITAADANYGAIVFFPAGLYRVTAALTVPNGVLLWGAGSSTSTIAVDAAATTAIAFTGTTTGSSNALRDLEVAALQATTASLITIASGCRVYFDMCLIGGAAYTTGANVALAASTTTEFYANRCRFSLPTTATTSMITSATAAKIFVRDCTFTAPASYTPTNGIVYGTNLYLDACTFNNVNCTTGTLSCVTFNTATVAGAINRCDFGTDGGTAVITAMTLGTYLAASKFSESGNVFGTDVIAYSYTVSAAQAGAQLTLGSRASRCLYVSDTATSYTVPLDQYGTVVLTSTPVGGVTLNATMPPAGAVGVVWVTNAAAGSRNFTPAAPFAITAAKAIGAAGVNSMTCWSLIHNSGGNTNTILNTWLV